MDVDFVSASRELLLSAALFVVMWSVLGRWVFKPFLMLLDEREQRTQGDEKKALTFAQDADQVVTSIEEELRSATVTGLAERDRHLDEARTKANKVLSEAYGKARSEVDVARDEIEKTKAEAQESLSKEAEAIASMVLEKVLGNNGEHAIH